MSGVYCNEHLYNLNHKGDEPYLGFLPFSGLHSEPQRRYVRTRPKAATLKRSVGLSMDDFDPCQLHAIDVRTDCPVTGFEVVEQNMPQVLALELADFLPKAWEESSWFENMDSPTQHAFYKKLCGIHGHEKVLYYPYWFFLAVCWGPGHPDLSTVRKDMSTLWKVDFPTDKIFYPGKESIKLQQSLFAGTRPDTKILLGVASRARCLERTIESTSVDDIAQALQDELPALLTPSAEAGRIKLLELELKVRTHQLLQTRRSMDTMNDKLESVEGTADEAYQMAIQDCTCREEYDEGIRECREEIQKLKTQLEASEKAHAETKDAYKKELAEANDKADKAIKTCAFLMSALLPPGSNKRKRETEGDEA